MSSPLPSIDFNAQHSPFGAFASFTVGRLGHGGGFGIELGGPADQDLFIGITRPGAGARAFPFFRTAADTAVAQGGAAAYLGEAAEAPDAAALPITLPTFAPSEITRTLGWASDTWQAGSLTFSLLTPFGPIPDITYLGDGELRRLLCPAILAEITLDNTGETTEAFAFFGVDAGDPLHPLSSQTGGALRGIARNGDWGFAIHTSTLDPADPAAAREALTWEMAATILSADSRVTPPLHWLADRGCLLLRAAPGERRTWTLALGFYRSGVVTSGIATTYLYSRLFPDLDAVLTYALEHAAHFQTVAQARDAELEAAALPEARKFLLAHATHSYHASTMLLHDEKGLLPRAPFSRTSPVHRPLWVVNEGEYRMMNTFDLTVDHAFWELRFHPWTLKNTLELFVSRYSYTDELKEVKSPDSPPLPGGISFTHDMGVANQFSPPGQSTYELPELTACFSYMTHEQLCNWCLCSAIYALPKSRPISLPAALTDGKNGDLLWLAARRTTLHACLESLIRRDGPNEQRDGIMSLDSTRCGSGQEITTYDSLDESLGQARANMYLAVKTWASYLALSRCFDVLGEDDKAAEAEEQAARAAATITHHWNATAEVYPAVLEPDSPGYEARILPLVEGLVYPYLLGDTDAVSPFGPFGELVSTLRRHLKSVIIPGICIDAESGWIKLSSTSTNTWMSKIFLCQFVAEAVLGVKLDGSLDEAHARWQCEGACADWAFTDQVRSTDGKDLGSRYYPRGVTSILWML